MSTSVQGEHRPVELDCYSGTCASEQCNHAAGECPPSMVTACEECTFGAADGSEDFIDPVPWPCQMAWMDQAKGTTA